MTTATAENTTVAKDAEKVLQDDPKLALQAVIAESEKQRIAYEREQHDSKALSEVTFGPEGLQATNLASLWRLALMLCRSDMVPEQYRQKPENCLIALQMAQRCRVDVFMFMQNTYIVHGRPGIEAKLAIAMLNMSGKIQGRMKFELKGKGPAQECTANVIDRETGEHISMTVDWKLVQAEGWDKPKKGFPSKWTTMPEIMFRYRSAMFLIRSHYPEVLLGMQTVDELDDFLGDPAAGSQAEAGEPLSAQDSIAEQLGVGGETQSASKPTVESKPAENQRSEIDTKSEPAAPPEEKPQSSGGKGKGGRKSSKPDKKTDDKLAEESELKSVFEGLQDDIAEATMADVVDEIRKQAVVDAQSNRISADELKFLRELCETRKETLSKETANV